MNLDGDAILVTIGINTADLHIKRAMSFVCCAQIRENTHADEIDTFIECSVGNTFSGAAQQFIWRAKILRKENIILRHCKKH